MATLRALIVEDVEADAELLVRELRRGGFEVTFERVETAEAMTSALDEKVWDIVLSDYSMPRFDGRAALSVVRRKGIDLPFIIVSGTVGEETAVEAMRAGAQDYFVKGKLGPKLIAAVERELREAAERRDRIAVSSQLAQSMEQLELLLSASRFMLYVCKADGDYDITYHSPNVQQILGYGAEDFFQKQFWQRGIHPDDRTGVLAELQTLLARGHHAFEYRFRHKDGSWRWMYDEQKVHYDAHGDPRSIVGSWADISNRKQTQEQLMISDRMVSMGTLAAGVAHEINNPLASVMANLDLAAEEVVQLATKHGSATELDDLRSELRDAREGAERIRNIVRDLRIFSRSREEGTRPIDAVRVMESTLRMAWNEIRHRARLVKTYGKVPPVMASESRLGQVFLNLVINAAQAIGEGRAEANEIRVSIRVDDGGRVVVEISDTGTGMPPEVLNRLFQPFFTTKPIGVGTGLGLSICQRIVIDLGGTIVAESEVGKGTVFRVTLPAADRVGPEVPASVIRELPAKRRGRILVIDDEPMIGRAIERTLSAEHEVVSVLSATEALARLSKERFDVILCDLMMPDVTGMDLHAELRRVDAEQADRVIFSTGGAFTPRARAFLDEVPNQRIEKPFDARHLRALINDRVR